MPSIKTKEGFTCANPQKIVLCLQHRINAFDESPSSTVKFLRMSSLDTYPVANRRSRLPNAWSRVETAKQKVVK